MDQPTMKREWLKLCRLSYVIRVGLVLFVPPLLQLFILRIDRCFVTPLRFFHSMLHDSISVFFPLFLLLVYPILYSDELKNSYLCYVHPRMCLLRYHRQKLIVSAIIGFGYAFLLVFLTYLFAMYVALPYQLAKFYFYPTHPKSIGTFHFLFAYGEMAYGIGYALWVALNGALYSVLILLLLMVVRNRLLALVLPMLGYFGSELALQFVDDDIYHYSPMFTIFSIDNRIHPVGVIITPMCILLLLIVVLYWKMKKNVRRAGDAVDH